MKKAGSFRMLLRNLRKQKDREHKLNPMENYNIELRKRLEAVEEIMENFDFERVHAVMDFLNWTWIDNPRKVPTVQALRISARGLLLDVVADPELNYAD